MKHLLSSSFLFLSFLLLAESAVAEHHLKTNNDKLNDVPLPSYKRYVPHSLSTSHCELMHNADMNGEVDMKGDAACQYHDELFYEQSQRRRELVDRTGTLNILVIPLAWPDKPADRILPSRQDIQDLWTGVGTNDVTHPSGSIANWTNVNSHGTVTLTATVVDWITADNTEIFYAAGRAGRPNGNIDGTAQYDDAIEGALRQLANDGFDFSPFDQDNDNVIDAIAVIHSGYAAELFGEDCTTGRTYNDRIQSHYFVAPDDETAWRGPGAIRMGSYITASAYIGRCQSRLARMGIMAHEFIHLFRFPELYDVAGRYQDNPGTGGLGGYDPMANPFGQGNRLAWPGHLSPWTKYTLGWLSPTEITSDGTYTLQPSELNPDCYVIASPYPDGEYLMLEVRRPILFDSLMWAPGGLLIYHVDEQAEGPGNQARGFPGQSGWPGNGNHYTVALLQQDGNYDLEKAIGSGGIDDFWKAGQSLGPGNGESVANSATYPNTDGYQNGNILVTGVTITNFVDNTDGSVTFEVQGMPSNSEPSFPIDAPPVPAPLIPDDGNLGADDPEGIDIDEGSDGGQGNEGSEGGQGSEGNEESSSSKTFSSGILFGLVLFLSASIL